MAEQPFVPKPESEEEPTTEPKALPEPKEDSSINDLRILTETKIKAAMAWLREELKAGPRPAAEMDELAQAKGFPTTTLFKARKRAGVRSERLSNGWMWSLASQRKQAAKTSGKK